MIWAIPTPSYATQTRLSSLGAGVQQITFQDDTNALRFPNTLLSMPGFAVVEGDGRLDAPSLSFTNASVHFSLGDTMAMGIHLGTHRRTAFSWQERWNSYAFGYYPSFVAKTPSWVRKYVPNEAKTSRQLGMEAVAQRDYATPQTLAHHASLSFAIKAMDGLDVGVRFGVLMDADASGSPQPDPIIWDGAVGLGFELWDGSIDLGTGVKTGVGRTEAGQRLGQELAVDFTARGSWAVRGGDSVQPFLNVVYTSPLEDEQPAGTLRAAGLMVNAGADYRLKLGDHVFVQPGAGISAAREAVRWDPDLDESSGNIVSVFYHLAVDIQITEWLDIRFGGSQELQFINANHGAGMINGDTRSLETSDSNVHHRVSSGLGLSLPAGFEVDVQASTDWGHSGPKILTGASGATLEASIAVSKRW